jgi:hypothetical protein
MLFSALSMAPLWQSQRNFEAQVRLANDLHERGTQVANELHREEQSLEAALHHRAMSLGRELHYGEMSHAITIARREAVRDVLSQKNQLLQTLMIVDTLMFSCAAAVFCEGDIPAATNVWVVRLYALTLGAAMSLLFVSIWFCMKLQTRMAHFDLHHPTLVYSCGRSHLHFNDYFACHCRLLEATAFSTFYFGTIATMVAGAVFVATAFQVWFLSDTAAGLYSAFAAAACVVAGVRVVFLIVATVTGADVVDVGGLAGDVTEAAVYAKEATDAQKSSVDVNQQADER